MPASLVLHRHRGALKGCILSQHSQESPHDLMCCSRSCACIPELDKVQAFSCLQASLDKVLGQLRQHVKAHGSSGGTLEELVSSLLEEHGSQVMQDCLTPLVELHCLVSCAAAAPAG